MVLCIFPNKSAGSVSIKVDEDYVKTKFVLPSWILTNFKKILEKKDQEVSHGSPENELFKKIQKDLRKVKKEMDKMMSKIDK